MGSLESKVKKERLHSSVQRALLTAVGISGLLLFSAAAPNAAQYLPRLLGLDAKFKYRMKSVASRLAAKGLIRFVDKNGKRYIELTPAGERELEFDRLVQEMQNRNKRKWDRRYRMVIFDIPETQKKKRVRLREVLKTCGFYQLQQSVWVYPYDCEDIVTLVKAELKAGSRVLYTIVEQIEYDTPIREHFGLR